MRRSGPQRKSILPEVLEVIRQMLVAGYSLRSIQRAVQQPWTSLRRTASRIRRGEL